MTIAVDLGRKANKQTKQTNILSFISMIITTSKSLEKTLLPAFHLAFEIVILVD